MSYLLAAAIVMVILFVLGKHLKSSDAAALREEQTAQAKVAQLRRRYWRAAVAPTAVERRRAS